jgi:hypothetical protein
MAHINLRSLARGLWIDGDEGDNAAVTAASGEIRDPSRPARRNRIMSARMNCHRF